MPFWRNRPVLARDRALRVLARPALVQLAVLTVPAQPAPVAWGRKAAQQIPHQRAAQALVRRIRPFQVLVAAPVEPLIARIRLGLNKLVAARRREWEPAGKFGG